MVQAECAQKNPADLDPEILLRQQGLDSLQCMVDLLNENGEAWEKKK